MAPTIYEDDNGLSNSRSTRRVIRVRKSSVINYVSRNRLTNRRVSSTSSVMRTNTDAADNMSSNSRESIETVLNSNAYQSVINDRNRLNMQRIDDDDTMDSVNSATSTDRRSESVLFRGFTSHDIRRHVKVEDDRDSSENDVSSSMEDGSTTLITTTTASIPTSASSICGEGFTKERSSRLTTMKKSKTPASTFPSPPPSPYVTSSNISTTSSSLSPLAVSHSNSPPPFSPALHLSNGSHRGLIEIAIKTIKLLQKNQLLQERLDQLQMETTDFVNSVMANPENANIREQIRYDNLRRDKSNGIKRSPTLSIRN